MTPSPTAASDACRHSAPPAGWCRSATLTAVSSLVPTPRTDKNGRTQIRHVRPTGPVPGARHLPAAPDLTPERRAVVSLLVEANRHNDLRVMQEPDVRALEKVCALDSRFRPLAARILTDGGSLARSAALATLEQLIGDVRQALDMADHPDQTYPAAILAAWTGLVGRRQLARAWAVGNVYDEFGEEARGPLMWRDEIFEATNLDKLLGFAAEAGESETDEPDWAYWRGIGAIRAVSNLRGGTPHEPMIDALHRMPMVHFARWAGTHEDLRSVVRVAVDRQTYDADTIKAVLDEEAGAAPAIREGVL